MNNNEPEVARNRNNRLPILDGWRGVSITLVLIGHMLPLGPKWLAFNSMVSAAGLSIFFFLSGFLVTSILYKEPNIPPFLVRRLFRIVPLAWAACVVLALMNRPTLEVWLANVLFIANWQPSTLMHPGDHLWSLSVEVQFYIAIAFIVSFMGRSGLFLIPLLCVIVTITRIANGSGYSIITWLRIDEILVGGAVALLRQCAFRKTNGESWPNWVTLGLIPLLFICCHEKMVLANYFRPYVTALLIYSSLDRERGRLSVLLNGRMLAYLASISYSLYVVHPLTYSGGLGSGDLPVKYSKRILSIVITFISAHLISKFFEKPLNNIGHRLAKHITKQNE